MKNLQTIFSTSFFRIPDYQRGYAWDEKNLNDLWNDIEEISLDETGTYRRHYTGTIYVEKVQPKEEERWIKGPMFYSLVDGQQRLTTLTILLFELIKAAPNDGYCGTSKNELERTYLYKLNSSGYTKVYKLSYEKGDPNYNFLLNFIYEDKNVILIPDDNNAYKIRLRKAKEFFCRKIQSLNTFEGKEVFFEKVSCALYFDFKDVSELLDVQAVFETMNNRGKPLSILEKLKNRLIYLTTKLDIPKEDIINIRAKINDSWKKVYISLSQNLETPLNEDIFLSAHLSLLRSTKEPTFSIARANEKIFNMFCTRADRFSYDWNTDKKEPRVTKEKISDYVESLAKLAPLWYKVHNSKNQSIQRILLLNSTQEVKVLLLSLLNYVEEDDPIFEKLEKIIFRNAIPQIGVCDNGTFAKRAKSLFLNEISYEKIDGEIDGYISIPVVSAHLAAYFKSLYDYINGKKGFYRWSLLKYFLFRYEDYLKAYYNEENNKIELNDFADTTIEHILPQSCESNWGNEINSVIGSESDPNRIKYIKKVLINTLGNLTILKAKKNSELQNECWNDKKQRYRSGSYNEIQLSENNCWGETQIMDRGRAMLSFMETLIDGLSFSEDDKIEILQPYKSKNLQL